MDSQLSTIKTDINLSEVPPLNRRRVVAFVNCYLMRLTDHLNEFALRSEGILLEAESQLRVTDMRLRILEAKLASVDPYVIPAPLLSTPITAHVEECITDHSSLDEINVTQSDDSSTVTASIDSMERVSAGSVNGLLVKDDPVFSKYFKMLKMGVIEQAVKIKMQSEGVDPSYLSTPDALSPNTDKAPTHSSQDFVESGDVTCAVDEHVNSDSDDTLSSFSDSD